MFSGIIQQLGQLQQVVCLDGAKSETMASLSSPLSSPTGYRIKVGCDVTLWSHRIIGESIAVDGVCLTVTQWDDSGFYADLSPETLQQTKPYWDHNNNCPMPYPVNLERAMTYGQPVGGHLVSGHVDGIGQIRTIESSHSSVSTDTKDIFTVFSFVAPSLLLPYIVPKGCIAINGISLTINHVQQDHFTVMLIPHTMSHTNLGKLAINDSVNLESDLMARYVVKASSHKD